jgi:ATP-dependent Clp protease ATP-binding subunit ClpA
MPFERFTKDARAAVIAARAEARAAGHPTVEAEHLLLAMAASPELHAVGLDRQRLLVALAEEEARSLASVGVFAGEFEEPPAGRTPRDPQFATSAKLALQRGLAAAAKRGDRRLDASHVLLGVLAAQHGRVPRALKIAGVDVDELRARV